MKTREQLREEGVLLNGPIVPYWFKARSDGCSIPTKFLKKVLRADLARAACYIHDYEYFLIKILYPPNEESSRFARDLADRRLMWNRKIVTRRRFLGYVASRMYFRGVRIGGVRTLKYPADQRRPYTLNQLNELQTDLVNYNMDFTGNDRLTHRASEIVKKWRNDALN